jgi:hypothetical protein
LRPALLFTLGGAFAAAAFTPSVQAADPGNHAIRIVSARFGRPDEPRPFDFTERLQATCGPSVTSCDAFCSPAEIGGGGRRMRMFFEARAFCRVTYRCGDSETRTADAPQDDTLYLRCREP